MKILDDQSIKSLKARGYIKREVNSSDSAKHFEIFQTMNTYNINPEPYLLLFNGLDTTGIRNLIRHVCLSWKNVAESLGDTTIDFLKSTPVEVCTFFMEKDHRTYFFIEIVHQYFFP